MKKVLLWVWQLPQNLLGLLVVLVFRSKLSPGLNCSEIRVWEASLSGFGVSLGNYIILSPPWDSSVYQHEIGHCVQSRILGPLYLFLVGIPSGVFNNLWDRLFHKNWSVNRRYQWYYNRWPEGGEGHWWSRFTADALGGVSRVFSANLNE
jgi:hypothetical protein